MIFNSDNMLGNEEDGAERRSGKRSVHCWELRNGKIEKPAARLGCVGGRGWGLALNVFMAPRVLCANAM